MGSNPAWSQFAVSPLDGQKESALITSPPALVINAFNTFGLIDCNKK